MKQSNRRKKVTKLENPEKTLKKVNGKIGFHSLINEISDIFEKIPDNRMANKVKYSLRDTLMSGLAMMYFQDPSLLQFSQNMQNEFEAQNLDSLFGIKKIPSETQMRENSDNTPTEELIKVFPAIVNLLAKTEHLKKFKVLDDYYLLVIDGSEYFSSNKIQCTGCLKKNSSNNKKERYSHQILQVALIHPDMRQVIPLAPEPIKNSDGTEKQDIEMNAAKRIIRRLRKTYPKMKIMIGGDGLFSKQPLIEDIKSLEMSYLFVAKPDDHKVMYRMIENRDKIGKVHEKIVIDEKNNVHTYRWTNQIDLNGNKENIKVNYFEYELFNSEKDKVTYKNSWVTDIIVSPDNIVELVKCGRARWKIENETFNTLKNQGYHIEHNYGHGKKYLSNNFFVLNLIAFLIHQIFELTDELYQMCRVKIGTRLELYNKMRSFLYIKIFEDWSELLFFLFNPSQATDYYQKN